MIEWQRARLFSHQGIKTEVDARQRAIEALLATLALVPAYATEVLGELGVRVDAKTAVETFAHVPLGAKAGETVDGVIRVRKGKKRWTAAVIARTGSAKLTPAAVTKARNLAGKANLDAVITITNDAQGPATGRSRSGLAMGHLGWATLVAMANNLRARDTEQAQVLDDLVALLGYPDISVISVADMGPHWVNVVKTARTSRLSARNAGVRDVAERWDQVVGQLESALEGVSGATATQVTGAQKSTVASRVEAHVQNLAGNSQLSATFRVRGAAGDMAVVADLAGRRLVAVVVVAPPEGLGNRATVGWLLDGLESAPDDTVVESWRSRARKAQAVATVAELRQDAQLLEGPNGTVGDSFRVLRAAEMPVGRSNSRRSPGFVEATTDFLLDSWQHLLGPLSGVMGVSPRGGSASPQATSGPTRSTRPSREAKPKKSTSPTRKSVPSSKRSSSSTRRSNNRKSPAELSKELRQERK